MAVLSWWNDLSGFQNIALFDSHFEEHFYDEPTTVRVDTTGPLMFVQSKIRNQRIRINNKGLLPSTYFPISLSRPPLVICTLTLLVCTPSQKKKYQRRKRVA